MDSPDCGFSGGETAILRKNGGFSGLWIFRRRNGNSPEKRWILRVVDLPRRNGNSPGNGGFSGLWIFCGETAILRKNGGFSGLWIFRRRNDNSPEKEWIFRVVDFPAEKRQFSGKTVDFPGCGFSGGETGILRKNGGFSGLLSYSRKTTYFRKKSGFSGLLSHSRKTTYFRKNGGFSNRNPPFRLIIRHFSKIYLFLRFFTAMPIITPAATRIKASAAQAAMTEPGLEKNEFFSTGGLGRSDSSSAVELTLMVMTCE